MFEKIVKSAFEKVAPNKSRMKKFYILTHKKHRREIYFEIGNKKAMEFMKIKFPSFGKRILYNLLRFKVLQIFLKKIYLPVDVGELVFVAGQIKVFNFGRGRVLSFPMSHQSDRDFLKSKKVQRRMGRAGFAPEITEIDEDKVFSTEEFLSPPKKVDVSKAFSKLKEYYSTQEMKRVSVREYVKTLRKKLAEKHVRDSFIEGILGAFEKEEFGIFLIKSHGDFAEGQMLIKGEEIYFGDWEMSENLLTEDVENFFRKEVDLMENRKVGEVVEILFGGKKMNLIPHLILGEIAHVAWKPHYLTYAKLRIKNLLRHLPEKNQQT